MSDDDAIIRKFQMRASSAQSPVYYVRQSEEELRNLQKENFNLKLKIYFLEQNRDGSTKMPEITNIDEKEYFDLVVENEALKAELIEKKEIMSNALDVIDLLEKQKEDEKRKAEELVDDYTKRIEELKVRSKLSKRKLHKTMKQVPAIENPNNTKLLEEELSAFKTQNTELFARINDVKRENISKNLMIEKLSIEKLQLRKQCDEMEKAFKENNNLIASLRKELSETTSECDMSDLLNQNKQLSMKFEELSQKYSKLDQKCRDYERIVNEQSEIMKALNRAIETKNDELDDYKARVEFNSTNFIQDNEINLNESSIRKYPFHNPLFGSFQSLYR
ncbi:CDK5 regulatory subunit-associated protein 2-like [Chironomus tepperi]|uniref:CDK5 regulatory subunit-associated protein 2-like n=1 Tax=Chironomus tepperi TaxID=113505 RepID=UPI00391EFC51